MLIRIILSIGGLEDYRFCGVDYRLLCGGICSQYLPLFTALTRRLSDLYRLYLLPPCTCKTDAGLKKKKEEGGRKEVLNGDQFLPLSAGKD